MADNFSYTLLMAKKGLDSINVPFFLACGTALGFYRGKKFIPHDRDIDLAIFHKDYRSEIRREMKRHGFKFLHQYGKLDNGLELSFQLPKTKKGRYANAHARSASGWRSSSTYPKLDIFFLYEEPSYYWRSGYEAKSWSDVDSGKEIPKQLCAKYTKFKLISVDFLGTKFLVPDISYIEQLYGPTWRIPNKDFKHFNIILPKNLKKHPFFTLNNEWIKHVTIGIKTFIRPECLVNCVTSIRLYYPDIRIVIADDSDDEIKDINRKNMKEFNVNIIDLPFDSGISYGRNRIVNMVNKVNKVNKVKSKYLVIIDDDTIITERTDLKKLYEFLEETNYDLIAGFHDDRNPYMAQFVEMKEKVLYFERVAGGLIWNKAVEAYRTDCALNIFMAKTEFLRLNPWNDELKLSEHFSFFVKAWQKRSLIAITPEVVFSEKKINSERYKSYRARADQITINTVPDKLGFDVKKAIPNSNKRIVNKIIGKSKNKRITKSKNKRITKSKNKRITKSKNKKSKHKLKL